MDFDGAVNSKSVNYICAPSGTILDLVFDPDDSDAPFEDDCVGSDC